MPCRPEITCCGTHAGSDFLLRVDDGAIRILRGTQPISSLYFQQFRGEYVEPHRAIEHFSRQRGEHAVATGLHDSEGVLAGQGSSPTDIRKASRRR